MKKINLFKKLGTLGVLLCSLTIGTVRAEAPVKIAITNWADVLAVANVVKYVMETKLDQPVQFVTADIGIQYQGIARGDVDLMVGGWLPVTHGEYYTKYKNQIVDVGVIYKGGKNGWIVPNYIPKSELSSIADLNKPEVKAKLKGIIQGIEPGGGLMLASEKAMNAYNLQGYKLMPSSEAGMLVSIARAYKSNDWVVATAWSPHWLFQKYNMRYLEDPKGALGGEESIHAFASKDFGKKFPSAYQFMKKFKLTLADVEKIENDGNTTGDYAAAAKKFVDANPKKLQAWLAK